jgi:AbrB family looped-hinge helix DNA binding protein
MVDMGTVVKMDKQGRILIPAAVRRRIGARLFVLEEGEGGELRLKPIREIRLTDLFDSIEVDVEDFTDTHELRRALARES